MDFGTLLFGFSGRINRAKWWLAVLIYFIIGVILAVLGIAAGQGTGMQIVSVIINLVVFISGLAVGIKRLHDRNKSGWWLLVFYVVPGILIVIGLVLATAGALGGSASTGVLGLVLNLAALGLMIWAFVELGCLRGTIGANQYGPDPLPPGA